MIDGKQARTFPVYMRGMWNGSSFLRSNELPDYIDSDRI